MKLSSMSVLIIGSGGAVLRAAIEASAAGVSVGMVCKCLLGKAHTVMAEGGIAAALANVDDRDNWKVHFADTMRGGRYVNNWRMAELHAKEAPARVRELEAWGAVFDRTRDGRILVAGMLVTEGVRGEGGILRTPTASVSCSSLFPITTKPRRLIARKKAGVIPRVTRTHGARRSY